MPDTIYIERPLAGHPRIQGILDRFPRARRIYCDCYTELFNLKAQNFRLQKQHPALILARKPKDHLLPIPGGYAWGGYKSFTFSHMLNCLYDCRYCCLQGKYHSAQYLLFINHEDFRSAMRRELKAARDEPVCFFSGHDCDSLAMDPISGFTAEYLPFFTEHPSARLELSTKSTQIHGLLAHTPMHNVVVAYSFTPHETARALEHRVPSVIKRLSAMRKLQDHGWKLSIHFDPLIYQTGFEQQYRGLFQSIFEVIEPQRLHSVSLNDLQLPRNSFNTMQRMYPEEAMFAGPLHVSKGMVGYRPDLERDLREFCTDELLRYIPQHIFRPCRY